MKRYKEYKDSGVQWLGEVPSHWTISSVRSLVQEYVEKNKPEKTRELLALSYSLGVTLYRDKQFNMDRVKENYEEYKIVHENVLVVSPNDIIKGSAYVSKYYGCISPMYITFKSRFEDTTYLLYLSYLLRTKQAGRTFFSLAKGLIGSILDNGKYVTRRMSVSRNDILSFKIAMPPLSEQKKILSYLESKTSKIDEYIAEKEKEVQLLNELKEAEIAKVVTQGLYPNVKMKDSGISWIGMIPEHWDVKRIASLFTGKVNTNSDFAYKHAFKFNYGTLVPKDEVGDAEEYRETYVKYQVLRKDDILINGLNLNYDFVSQRVAIAPSDGIITSAYIVARPRKGTNADYYNYLFKAMDSKKLFHGMGTGIRLTLSFDELKKQIVVCPPIDEQQAIVAYINEKTAKVESLITVLQAEIEHLKEYKQRLIADCVTGQVNVQNE